MKREFEQAADNRFASVLAEENVLRTMFRKPEVIEETLLSLSAGDFADKDLGRVYYAFEQLAEKGQRQTAVTVNAFLPKYASIPLCESEKETVEVLVKEGDIVKEGDVIAKSNGVYTHSSIPGRVVEIVKTQYADGMQGLIARVALDGALSYLGKKRTRQNWQSLEPSTISFLLKERGVVNTFHKTRSLYAGIEQFRQEKGEVVTLRLVDEDPSMVTETFVASREKSHILEGLAIVAQACGAKAVVVAVSSETDFLTGAECTSELSQFFGNSVKIAFIALDTKKYPVGKMHDLVLSVKRKYKDTAPEFAKIGRKDLFIDATTALAVYNAIALDTPVLSSFVHVTGDCLNAAAVMNVKIGTPLKDLVEQCGGFKRKLSKIVINGLVSGTAVSSLDIPVSRGVRSVEFVPVSQAKLQHSQSCVRCGNCRKICPVALWPGNLYRIAHLSENERRVLNTKEISDSALLCNECGLCNSVCPSRIPLSQTIALLKESKINEVRNQR